MKTIQELKKENWNDEKLGNLSGEEVFMINHFPYDSWLPENIRDDYSLGLKRDFLRNGSLPCHEEILPEKFKMDEEGDLVIGEKYNKGYSKLEVGSLPIHYSTNREIWEIDYINSRNSIGDFEADLKIPDIDKLSKVLNNLKNYNIKYKKPVINKYPKYNKDGNYLGSADIFVINIKLVRKNYFAFRKFLLGLKNLDIVVAYDYSEIRWINNNSITTVYI